MSVRIIEPIQKAQKVKKKVCAYARVSTDNDKQGESLENQIQYYENIISNNPDYEYVGVFADRGVTGTTENRPEFQRMLELCRNKNIDLIITKSISRFVRNTAIMLQIVRELKDIGIEVRFEKENINTLLGDGELMLTVLSSFAQEESKNVSDNLKWRARKKFEQGELIINLIINEKQAKIVRRIYKAYLDGKGINRIARELEEEEIPNWNGKAKWYENSIRKMLSNEKYKGEK